MLHLSLCPNVIFGLVLFERLFSSVVVKHCHLNLSWDKIWEMF